MRLKNLKIRRFLGIHEAEIDFEKRITLFLGPNSQGKSSIRDALMFAFTGQARDVKKFKDVSKLAAGGEDKEMEIKLQLYDGDSEFSVIRTKKNPSQGIEIFPAMTPYCLDPLAFLKLSTSKRSGLLTGILAEGIEDFAKEAIAEHVGVIPDELLKELKGLGTVRSDPDELRNDIIEIRRRMKRDIDPGRMPDLRDFNLPQDYDIEADKEKLKEVTNEYNDLERSRDSLKRAEKLAKEIDELGKRQKKLQAAKEPSKADKRITDRLKLYETIQEIASKSVRSGCLVCGAKNDTEFWELRLKNLKREYDDTLKESSKAQVRLDNWEKAQRELPQIQRDLDRMAMEIFDLGKLAGVKELPDNLEERLAELQAESRKHTANIDSYKRYRIECGLYEDRYKKVQSFKELIEECNRIDDTLKDGGPVKAAITAAGKSLPLDPALLEAWSIESLDVRNNGEIYLHGRDIEAASASEFYRVAQALGLALADLCGVGFCCLDGFEILVGDVANGVISEEILGSVDVNNVLIFGSTTNNSIESNDLFDVYWVEDGQVK